MAGNLGSFFLLSLGWFPADSFVGFSDSELGGGSSKNKRAPSRLPQSNLGSLCAYCTGSRCNGCLFVIVIPTELLFIKLGLGCFGKQEAVLVFCRRIMYLQVGA